MAIDPSPSPRAVAGDLPPDENVVSTYRAIAPAAIASLILGLASILTFLWPYFAGLGALAILAGVLAIRAIRRLPEALTGERMANAGIALGLMFSLAALTIDGVQSWQARRSADRFVRTFLQVLRSGSVEEALYYQANPAGRKDKTPREIFDEMKQGAPRGMFDSEIADTKGMIERLASTPGQAVEVGRLADFQVVGLTSYVSYILVFRGPKTQAFPAERQFALVQLQGFPEGRGYAWKVAEAKFPLPAEKAGL